MYQFARTLFCFILTSLCVQRAVLAVPAPTTLSKRGKVLSVATFYTSDKINVEEIFLERRSLTNGYIDISQSLLDDLSFFSQYATASYCEINNNSPNTELSCIGGICPLVEEAATNTLTEFEK